MWSTGFCFGRLWIFCSYLGDEVAVYSSHVEKDQEPDFVLWQILPLPLQAKQVIFSGHHSPEFEPLEKDRSTFCVITEEKLLLFKLNFEERGIFWKLESIVSLEQDIKLANVFDYNSFYNLLLVGSNPIRLYSISGERVTRVGETETALMKTLCVQILCKRFFIAFDNHSPVFKIYELDAKENVDRLQLHLFNNHDPIQYVRVSAHKYTMLCFLTVSTTNLITLYYGFHAEQLSLKKIVLSPRIHQPPFLSVNFIRLVNIYKKNENEAKEIWISSLRKSGNFETTCVVLSESHPPRIWYPNVGEDGFEVDMSFYSLSTKSGVERHIQANREEGEPRRSCWNSSLAYSVRDTEFSDFGGQGDSVQVIFKTNVLKTATVELITTDTQPAMHDGLTAPVSPTMEGSTHFELAKISSTTKPGFSYRIKYLGKELNVFSQAPIMLKPKELLTAVDESGKAVIYCSNRTTVAKPITIFPRKVRLMNTSMLVFLNEFNAKSKFILALCVLETNEIKFFATQYWKGADLTWFEINCPCVPTEKMTWSDIFLLKYSQSDPFQFNFISMVVSKRDKIAINLQFSLSLEILTQLNISPSAKVDFKILQNSFDLVSGYVAGCKMVFDNFIFNKKRVSLVVWSSDGNILVYNSSLVLLKLLSLESYGIHSASLIKCTADGLLSFVTVKYNVRAWRGFSLDLSFDLVPAFEIELTYLIPVDYRIICTTVESRIALIYTNENKVTSFRLPNNTSRIEDKSLVSLGQLINTHITLQEQVIGSIYGLLLSNKNKLVFFKYCSEIGIPLEGSYTDRKGLLEKKKKVQQMQKAAFSYLEDKTRTCDVPALGKLSQLFACFLVGSELCSTYVNFLIEDLAEKKNTERNSEGYRFLRYTLTKDEKPDRLQANFSRYQSVAQEKGADFENPKLKFLQNLVSFKTSQTCIVLKAANCATSLLSYFLECFSMLSGVLSSCLTPSIVRCLSLLLDICGDDETILFEYTVLKVSIYPALTWEVVEQLQLAYWVQSRQVLLKICDKIAKDMLIRHKRDPFPCLLFFIATNKPKVAAALFKLQKNAKVASLLSQDFSNPKQRNIAEKNAYALFRKKEMRAAAAFFILAGKNLEALRLLENFEPTCHLALFIARIILNPQELAEFMKNKTTFHLIKNWDIPRAGKTSDYFLTCLDETIARVSFESNCEYFLLLVATHVLSTRMKEQNDKLLLKYSSLLSRCVTQLQNNCATAVAFCLVHDGVKLCMCKEFPSEIAKNCLSALKVSLFSDLFMEYFDGKKSSEGAKLSGQYISTLACDYILFIDHFELRDFEARILRQLYYYTAVNDSAEKSVIIIHLLESRLSQHEKSIFAVPGYKVIAYAKLYTGFLKRFYQHCCTSSNNSLLGYDFFLTSAAELLSVSQFLSNMASLSAENCDECTKGDVPRIFEHTLMALSKLFHLVAVSELGHFENIAVSSMKSQKLEIATKLSMKPDDFVKFAELLETNNLGQYINILDKPSEHIVVALNRMKANICLLNIMIHSLSAKESTSRELIGIVKLRTSLSKSILMTQQLRSKLRIVEHLSSSQFLKEVSSIDGNHVYDDQALFNTIERKLTNSFMSPEIVFSGEDNIIQGISRLAMLEEDSKQDHLVVLDGSTRMQYVDVSSISSSSVLKKESFVDDQLSDYHVEQPTQQLLNTIETSSAPADYSFRAGNAVQSSNIMERNLFKSYDASSLLKRNINPLQNRVSSLENSMFSSAAISKLHQQELLRQNPFYEEIRQFRAPDVDASYGEGNGALHTSFAIASHPYLNLFVTGGSDEVVEFWTHESDNSNMVLKKIAPLEVVREHSYCTSLRFSSDGNYYLHSNSCGKLQVYPLDHDICTPLFEDYIHTKRCMDAIFLAENIVVSSGQGEYNMTVTDLRLPFKISKVCKVALQEAGATAYCVTSVNEQRQLVLGCGSGNLTVFDFRMRNILQTLKSAHTKNVRVLASDPYGSCFASGSTAGGVKAWYMGATLEEKWHMKLLHPLHLLLNQANSASVVAQRGVTDMFFTQEHLYTCGADGTVKRMKKNV
eukprot:snap_masked-scaffold_9-processed-gene-5.23-mRNA-1 protein AED:1.00 eAED:1.00 QI:0/0/0/0/1/1/3/0/2038